MEWPQIPIIVLSARGGEISKVKCLEIEVDETLARVKAVIRRVQASKESASLPAYNYSDLVMDFVNHLVSLQGESINLTATEYRMLAYLALNTGR